MRILTFLHSFEPGGVERVALRLVRHWRSLGVDCPLFMGRIDGAMANDIGHDLEVITPNQFIPTAWWETLWMIITLPAAIRRERPDVLFCAGNTYAIVAVAMKLIQRDRCPPILAKISNALDRVDNPRWFVFAYRCWLRIVGRRIDHFVGMEDAAHDELVEFLGIPAEKITIIPSPALSLEVIQAAQRAAWMPRCNPASGRHFVAVGRLARQKNFPLLLRAFQRGSRADDRLTLIGEGPERQRLAALAEWLGIADRVAFHGYVSSPIASFHEYDVLLLSSDFEGVPAVILEALAAGLGIIATDCSRAMSSLLKQGRLGTLVPVADEARMAQAIAQAQPGQQLSKLARAQAARFTLENAAELYLATFAWISRTEACGEMRNFTQPYPAIP